MSYNSQKKANMEKLKRVIWTIGHSTSSLEEFLSLLHSFQINLLADIRNYPGSKRYPHFNKEALEVSLPQNNIKYQHLKDLGGRRKPIKDSVNTAWQHAAFRGYADYMETATFKKAIADLESAATNNRTAYMCSEAVWWSCYRSLVSDFLKVRGWTVLHIMGSLIAKEHPYTAPAQIVNSQLVYSNTELFEKQ